MSVLSIRCSALLWTSYQLWLRLSQHLGLLGQKNDEVACGDITGLMSMTGKEYQALIYGGANVVAGLAGNAEDTIGMRNAGTAMELLMAENVTITVADVGETWSRRISFDVSTGEVDVKKRGQTFIAK